VSLSSEERRRYSRHLLLPEIGEAGQARLKAARVLLVGAGGLGSPAALYLAAAGVGTIGLVEFDRVDETNLQRQILYGTSDVGAPKIDVATTRIRAINPHVTIERHDVPFGAANGLDLVRAFDVVVDGTDNFATRYLVNDACVLTRTPNVYGSVHRFEGQASVFATAEGPCYRCLHPEPPPAGLIPNCEEAGVLGVLPGVIGTIQATEAIKIITGAGEPLVGRVLLYDALRMRMREITLPRDPECPVCGTHPTIRHLIAYEEICAPATAQGAGMADERDEISPDELRAWRQAGKDHLLIDVREVAEHAMTSIEGARLIPLGELARHLDELPTDKPIVLHCQGGGRSFRGTMLLRSKGFDALNLVGGIRAWRQTE